MPSHYLLTICLLSVCDHVVLLYIVRRTRRTLYVIRRTCRTLYVIRCILYRCNVVWSHRCTVALTLALTVK